MKKILTLICTLLCCGILFSQTPGTSGTIVYEQKIKFQINLGGQSIPGVDTLPQERKSSKSLNFTPEATFYQNAKNTDDNQMGMDAPEGVQIMMVEPEDIIYSDITALSTTEQREFMTRMFLITSDLKRHVWKMTGKQKTILNYPCQEAVLADTSKHVTAWFTPLIPVASGPAGFGNLPGMILEISFEKGDRVIVAKSVEIKDVDKTTMIKPKKGKKVTREEYNSIVDEKMKEMGESGGQGGHQMIIKINR